MAYSLNDLELILRRDRLDDVSPPQRWTPEETYGAINQAQDEVCRRAPIIIDGTTDGICRIVLRPGVAKYPLDPRVVQVREAYIGPVGRGDTFSWDAEARRLSDSGAGFVTAGFMAGTRIIVNGFTKTLNNGLFTIESVTDGALIVSESSMSDEAPATLVEVKADQAGLIKSTRFLMDEHYYMRHWQTWTGRPAAFIQEETDGITFVPIPDEFNTVNLLVSRLPLQAMTPDTVINGVTTVPGIGPEIAQKYCVDMLDWACKLAYEKGDEETLNLNLAAYWEKQFSAKFGEKPSSRVEEFRRKYPRGVSANPKEFGFS